MGSRTLQSGSDKINGDRCEEVIAIWFPTLLAVVAACGLSSRARGQSQNEIGKPLPEAPAVRSERGPRLSQLAQARLRAGKRPRTPLLESDNLTFRPTVLVRRGTSQGSGTIIASLDGQTLILTASHVIRGRGAIQVELHRYNLGMENIPGAAGQWPRQVSAETVATDAAADVAILRIRNMIALPFVA